MCFKHTHSRYPKIPSLAHGVQRYGWLERHPRIQAIFYGIVCFKHNHSRHPKTPFLAHGVPTYEQSVPAAGSQETMSGPQSIWTKLDKGYSLCQRPPKKVIQLATWTGQGILARFRGILKARDRILIRFGSDVQVFRSPVPNPPKTLELGEPKAGNGFSTLKIGGYHVVSPWDPFLLTRRPPCRARR